MCKSLEVAAAIADSRGRGGTVCSAGTIRIACPANQRGCGDALGVAAEPQHMAGTACINRFL